MSDPPACDRRSTPRVLDTFMLAIATCATLVAIWIVVGSLTHEACEQVLLRLAAGLFVAPVVLLILPRTCIWTYWVAAGWAVLLGVRYCGDMGADGHMHTSVFVFLAACWAILVGLAVRMVRKRLFSATRAPQARWRNMKTTAAFLAMVCAVGFLSNRVLATIHLHREQRQLAAPFEAVGMRVYFDAAGGISIQCDDPRFGDQQLFAVIDHLRELNDLDILNLYFTSITDESLRELRSLESLEYLGLYQTGVTDAGIDHLITMRRLERLDLRQTNITDEGLIRLQDALSGCLIER